MEWISVEDDMPALGQKVILFANGIVQNETYELDRIDINDLDWKHIWARDEMEDCPLVMPDHKWMPLPQPPIGE